MAKKTKKQINRSIQQAEVYKWEFLRRNKEYVSDYHKFCKGLKNKKKALTNKEYKSQQQKLFQKKYGINKPIDPKISVRSITHDHLKRKLKNVDPKRHFLHKMFFAPTVRSLFEGQEPVKCLNQLKDKASPDNMTKMQNIITISVDLGATKEIIMHHFKSIIDTWKRTHSRKRLEEYKRYIQILDLKKEGKSIKQIAEIIFPGYEESYDRVRKEVKAAQNLVNQSYQKIR